MSHLSKFLLLTCLACAAACTVPTIEEVEQEEGPAGCNDTNHKCPANFACFENRCIRVTQDMQCTPGTRQACGSDVGECRQGTQLCGADGSFGACENEVAAVREFCDGRDNDCDNQVDYWNGPLTVTKSSDLGSWVALVPVRRTPDGKQDTLLTLASESGSLVARTLAPDGTLKERGTLSRPALNVSYVLPALAADGDTVAAAWIEQTYQSGTNTMSYKARLTLLDGSGNRTSSQMVEIALGAPSYRIRVAINTSHVLLLINTFDGLSEKVSAYTIARDLSMGSLQGPFPFGIQSDGFGTYATANGTGDAFVVVYEDTSATSGAIVKKTVVMSNDGKPVVGPFAVTLAAFNHSPYIAPLQGDALTHTLYYVQNDPGGVKESQIVTVTCDRAGCGAPQTIASDIHQIESMQMAARPGAWMPEAALWTWTENVGNVDQKVLFAATFTPSGVSGRTLLRTPGPPVLYATLAVLPDSTRYLAYHQYPPAPSTLAVGYSNTEAYLLPFCGP